MGTSILKTKILWCIIGCILVACNSTPNPPPTVNTSSITSVPTQTVLASTPTRKSELALTVTPDFSTPNVTMVKMCPVNSLISLEELGLSDDLQLLVVPEESKFYFDEAGEGLFRISLDMLTPTRIATLEGDSFSNSKSFRVSPDGQWILFQRKDKARGQITPWIASLDGLQQWPLSIMTGAQNAMWLDSKTVLLFSENGADYHTVNPFTMETMTIENAPSTNVYGIGSSFFQYSNQTHLLYQFGADLNAEYHLFNAETQTDQQVLSWFSAQPANGPLDKGILLRPDGLNIVLLKRPYGFDISSPLDVGSLIASRFYSETMQAIVLPPEIASAIPSGSFSGYPSIIVLAETTPSQNLYLFNYEKHQVTVYCVDPNGFAKISPDGRFAAFTYLSLPSPQPIPKTLVVLNLENGYVSQLDGFEFIDWAVIEK